MQSAYHPKHTFCLLCICNIAYLVYIILSDYINRIKRMEMYVIDEELYSSSFNKVVHGATVTFVASQEGRRGPSRKHVLPRNSRTGIATRRSRKKPSKHVEEPMMTTSATW